MIRTNWYTPGPWKIDEPNGKNHGFRIKSASEAWFGCGLGSDETVANVRLCAAAPELLEALEEIVCIGGRNEKQMNDRSKAALYAARAAIAKAYGETP